MRTRALLSLVAAAIAAVALVSASGAATTRAQKVARIDVSTRAAVIHYLRSIHVNPKGAVVQRGLHNYAGAHCPGRGWNCTRTTHPVVQVAKAGGRNTFRCTTRRCAVVQVAMAPAALTNTAACIKATGLSQSCTISQSSSTKDNVAIVYENATKSSGLTQTASSTASITQLATGSASANTACVFQNVDITGSTVAKKGTPVTVTLEAHQSVTIKQDSMHGGNAAAQSATSSGHCTGGAVAQTQTLKSIASGSGQITQNEDAAAQGPNVALDIEQNQSSGFIGIAGGANSAVFNQTSNLQAIANTPHGPVSQTQSSPDTNLPYSGLVGTVNQDSRDISTADATQTETQCEDAVNASTTPNHCDTNDPDPPGYPLTQIQYGPEGVFKAPSHGQGPVHYVHKGVGTATQTGNSGDSFGITQTSTQDDDQGPGSQQTNVVQGDCSTSGNCTVDQTTTVDGKTTTNSQSGSDVTTQTTCSGSDCTGSSPGALTLLPNGLSVTNTDITGFGTGGMRGSGDGTIVVGGVTGPVLHAFLYWHGPTNSSDPDSNATVTVNGNSVTGTNIGTDSDNNWGFENSQSYRADVTGLVNGDGTYNFTDFVKTDDSGTVADINGVSLVIFYDDGDPSNDRNVVLWNGNDSNFLDGAWDETIGGVPYPGSGSAELDLIVSDGQSFNDGELDVNGTSVAGPGAVFQGDAGPNYSGNPEGVTGSLWDVKSFDITSLLTAGSNDLHITSPAVADALSLVVAIANVPASAEISEAPRTAVHTFPPPTSTKYRFGLGLPGALK